MYFTNVIILVSYTLPATGTNNDTPTAPLASQSDTPQHPYFFAVESPDGVNDISSNAVTVTLKPTATIQGLATVSFEPIIQGKYTIKLCSGSFTDYKALHTHSILVDAPDTILNRNIVAIPDNI